MNLSWATGLSRKLAQKLDTRVTALEAGVSAVDLEAIAAQVAVDPTISSVATTAGTDAANQAISALTAGAPAMMNTFDEIAAALGDDPNALAALTAVVNGKASASLFTMGSFTPSFTLATPGTLAVSFNGGYSNGQYLRVRDYVFFLITMAFTPTYGTGSGALRFTLPFTSSADPVTGMAVPTALNGAFTWPVSGDPATPATQIAGSIGPGQNYLTLQALKSAGGVVTLTSSHLAQVGAAINIAGFYKAAAV
jgi:hypothetical protein